LGAVKSADVNDAMLTKLSMCFRYSVLIEIVCPHHTIAILLVLFVTTRCLNTFCSGSTCVFCVMHAYPT
jgi:hypothetical protein